MLDADGMSSGGHRVLDDGRLTHVPAVDVDLAERTGVDREGALGRRTRRGHAWRALLGPFAPTPRARPPLLPGFLAARRDPAGVPHPPVVNRHPRCRLPP